MRIKISWLSGLLALQLVLAAGLLFAHQGDSGSIDRHPLLSIIPDRIDKVVITGSDGSKVVVQQVGDTWLLPELQNLPANSAQLEELLRRVSELKTNWPVTTTKTGQERFEVADDKFRRKLELYDSGSVFGTLYLGTSPGFKKSNVRAAGEDDVYALALSDYDLPLNNEDWLDKSLLADQNVTDIKGEGFGLAKNGESWSFENGDGTKATTALNQGKAKQLAQTISSLDIVGVADKNPDFTSDKTITLDVDGAKKVTYQLLESDGEHYIKRSDIDPVFTINEYEYKKLAEMTGEELQKLDKPAANHKTAHAEQDSIDSKGATTAGS